MGEAPALCAREQAWGVEEAEFTLHETHIEADPAHEKTKKSEHAIGNKTTGKDGSGGGALVPLDDRALDLKVGKANRRLPALGRLEDEVVEGLGNLGVLANVGVCAR